MNKKKEAKKMMRQELHDWLRLLWSQLPVKKECQSCGAPIWGDFKSIYFDHLLEKEIYPKYRMNPSNIYLVCANCHVAKTNGWPSKKHMEAIKKALSLHKMGTL